MIWTLNIATMQKLDYWLDFAGNCYLRNKLADYKQTWRNPFLTENKDAIIRGNLFII